MIDETLLKVRQSFPKLGEPMMHVEEDNYMWYSSGDYIVLFTYWNGECRIMVRDHDGLMDAGIVDPDDFEYWLNIFTDTVIA